MMKNLEYTARNERGFTLVEVVIVLVISGILMAVALRSGRSISESAKVEATKQEMDLIAAATIGNPELQSNGTQNDFGYVGDVGALPPNLTALVTNPGYATWKGPYIRNAFTQVADDYSKDAWGVAYAYSGGVAVQSTGSGNTISRSLANSTNELLRNSMTGVITDFDGTPPGPLFSDSISLQLTYPNGAGGIAVSTKHPAADGYYSFDSLPIGSQNLLIVYEPLADTMVRVVTILPGSKTNADQRLPQDLWTYGALHSGGGSPGGVLTHVASSDTARGQASYCDGFFFWVVNPGTASVTISNLTLTWSSPSGYYSRIRVGTRTVYNRTNARKGTGELAAFSRSQVIRGGQSAKIWIDRFVVNRSGNSARVPMSNTTIQVRLSDGSTFSVVTAGCM